MKKEKRPAKKAEAVDKPPARTPRRIWRILCSAFTGSSDELRFTQTGGVELVMEEFLKRKSVQKRIEEMADLEMPPPPHLARSGRRRPRA